MTDDSLKEQIAAARYALIALLVSLLIPLAPGELRQWLHETANHRYELPGSYKQVVSECTETRKCS